MAQKNQKTNVTDDRYYTLNIQFIVDQKFLYFYIFLL